MSDDNDSGSDNDVVAEENKMKEFEDLRNPDVVTKYRLSADIAQGALKEVKLAAKEGAKIVDLCIMGDNCITEATSKIYKGGKIQKGIAFPTCISCNSVVGSFSPAKGDATVLNKGDLVKIDLGVHIDGYVALVAHSYVVGDEKITGRKADVLAAAYTAAEVTARLLKPGCKNTQITDAIQLVAKQFNVVAVESVLSHQLKRFEIEGEKVVANNIPDTPLTGEQKIKSCEIEAHEAWALDIVLSTGSGKPQRKDERETTVFKRKIDASYKLKIKASRAVFSEVVKKFPSFPFSMRQIDFDEKKIRLGLVNCAQHGLLEPYPILHEKGEDSLVAHVKFTALIMPNGTMKITGDSYDISNLETEYSVKDDKLKAILAEPLRTAGAKKKKKKRKKKKANESAAAKPEEN